MHLWFIALLSTDSSMALHVDQIAEDILQQRYTEAISHTSELQGIDTLAACVLHSMVLLARYDDLGDTLAILQSQTNLPKCQGKTEPWASLAKFQMGYVLSELGSPLQGALATRSVARPLAKSPYLDLRALHATYAFYLEEHLGWIPFMADKRVHHLAVLDTASRQSRWFKPLFGTSLAWMHYDRKEYVQGLGVVDNLLRLAPQHHVFLHMRADMLYRLGRLDEAAAIYQKSAEEYAQRAPGSVRWWCAVANLVRIHAARGDSTAQKQWQVHLAKPEFNVVRKWMPPSLVSDLKAQDLLP